MATVPKTNPPRVLDALKMKVGIRVPGRTGRDAAAYRILTGASVLDLPSGTRPVSQIPTFDGVATIAAAKSNENISFNLGVWQPHLPAHQDLARADAQRLTVGGRMDIYAEEIVSYGSLGGKATAGVGITAPVLDGDGNPSAPLEAAKGSLLNGTGLPELRELARDDLLLVGDLVQIAAANPATAAARKAASYIVNYVEHDDDSGVVGNIYVTDMDGMNVAADVTADVFSAWQAGWRQPFSGKVNELRAHSADASGSPQVSSSVSFTPHGKLPPEQVLFVPIAESDWLKAA